MKVYEMSHGRQVNWSFFTLSKPLTHALMNNFWSYFSLELGCTNGQGDDCLNTSNSVLDDNVYLDSTRTMTMQRSSSHHNLVLYNDKDIAKVIIINKKFMHNVYCWFKLYIYRVSHKKVPLRIFRKRWVIFSKKVFEF